MSTIFVVPAVVEEPSPDGDPDPRPLRKVFVRRGEKTFTIVYCHGHNVMFAPGCADRALRQITNLAATACSGLVKDDLDELEWWRSQVAPRLSVAPGDDLTGVEFVRVKSEENNNEQ